MQTELFDFDYIKYTKTDSKGYLRTLIEFICDECNKSTIQRVDEFKRKGKLCRACKAKINTIESYKYSDYEQICANIMFDRLNKRYLKRGLICNIDKKDLAILLKQDCHYCGEKPSNEMVYKLKHSEDYLYRYNGLDRINSDMGYLYGNVVTACKRCNVAKMDMSYNEFIMHIKKIYNYLVKDANI